MLDIPGLPVTIVLSWSAGVVENPALPSILAFPLSCGENIFARSFTDFNSRVDCRSIADNLRRLVVLGIDGIGIRERSKRSPHGPATSRAHPWRGSFEPKRRLHLCPLTKLWTASDSSPRLRSMPTLHLTAATAAAVPGHRRCSQALAIQKRQPGRWP